LAKRRHKRAMPVVWEAFNIISNYRQNGAGFVRSGVYGVENNVFAWAIDYNFDYVICSGI